VTPEDIAKAHRARAAGEEAKRLLDSSAFADALKRVEEKYSREWRASTGPSIREALWTKLSVLDDVINDIRVMIGNGDMAAHTLAKEAERDRSK